MEGFGLDLELISLILRLVRAPEGARRRRDAGIFAFRSNHSGCTRVRLRLEEGAGKGTRCKQERMQ